MIILIEAGTICDRAKKKDEIYQYRRRESVFFNYLRTVDFQSVMGHQPTGHKT